MIHLSNSFRFFFFFHPSVILRVRLENTFEFFFLFSRKGEIFFTRLNYGKI